MQSYIEKPNFVKKQQIENKLYSFSAGDFGYLVYGKSKITKSLGIIATKEFTGREIGSESYTKKSTYRFLKTVNIGGSMVLQETSIEYCKPSHKLAPQQGDILIVKDGGGNGLGEVCLYTLDNKNNTDIISAGIYAFRIPKEHRYYVLGMLKSQHFKDYNNINTPGGSIIRHAKKIAFDYEIPFPTTQNHPHPEQVESLVSFIVQNIINKEEQIKIKNQQIDTLIEQELSNNQKPGTFSYRYPRISEIKDSFCKLDTGLYERKIRKITHLIQNYSSNYSVGYYMLSDFYNCNRGQNLQVSQIGESFYSDIEKKGFYRMFTNIEMQDNRTISGFRRLGNKNKLTLLPDNSILFSADGMIVGRSFFYDKMENTITNIHPWVITAINMSLEIYKRIFTSLFLSYLKNIGFLEKIKDKSNGGGIKKEHLDNRIKIPNFPDSKQQEIAQLYYNPLAKNTTLSFSDYLILEQNRNHEIGIFQLNMEIFALREQLETLVHKIVMEEKIEIDLNY